MRQLLLLRHAKSGWDDPRLSDHDRPLSQRGAAAAAAMGAALRRLRLSPELVLVSTARRTMETLRALEPFGDSTLVDPLDSLYLASAERLLEILRATPETVRSVLVVGHNPGMQNLAMALVGPAAMARGGNGLQQLADRYPTGALAEFAIAGPWWGLDSGGGRLVRFMAPSDLPPDRAPEQAV